MCFLFQGGMFRFHVNFRCVCYASSHVLSCFLQLWTKTNSGRIGFFAGVDFLIVCFFSFGPLPFAGMLFIAIHNSEKWFKFFLFFLLQLRNEAMVQWWLGNNLDDELWTSRERYCSSKQEHLEIWHTREVFEVSRIYRNHFDITFWNFIDLPIFSDSTVYSLFFIFSFLTKITPPNIFSNNTSTKMVVNSPRTSTKNGVSLHFHWNFHWNFHRNVRSPNFHRNSPIQPSDSPTSSGPAMPSTLTPTGAAQVVLFSSLERFPSLMRTVGRHFWWTVFSFSYAVRIWYIYDLIW